MPTHANTCQRLSGQISNQIPNDLQDFNYPQVDIYCNLLLMVSMTCLVSETWEFIETPGCWAVLHKRDTPLETKMAAKELSNSESRNFFTAIPGKTPKTCRIGGFKQHWSLLVTTQCGSSSQGRMRKKQRKQNRNHQPDVRCVWLPEFLRIKLCFRCFGTKMVEVSGSGHALHGP